MAKARWSKFRSVIRNLGAKSIAASVLVFLITVAVTCMAGFQFYRTTKENIRLQGHMNAVQSAREFDSYLMIRKNTVILAGHVVDEMIREGLPHSEILEYMTAESQSIKKSIDKDYTGLYGWINGEYCDGDGWVPDEDYVPTERPWYLETVADNSDFTFVRPYLDEQTGTVLTTMAERLSDRVSVIALDITLSRIQEITEELARQSPGSLGIVLDKTGQVIAHSDASELGKNYLEETDTLGAALADKLYNGGGSQFDLHFGNQDYVVFSERIEGDWQAVSVTETDIFYRPLKIILSVLAVLTLLEAAVFLSVLYSQSEKNLAIASAEAAQSANRAKSQFLSRMSHEIRTPINAIIGLDSIALHDENISPRTRDGLNKIGASARHLLSLVNDILDMSRIESGRLELRKEVFSLPEFLDQIGIIIGGQCDDKGLRFTCERGAALEERYIGDHLKLKQVLINILGNAVKFTDPPGEILFTAEQTSCTEDQAALRFTMTDTGIGMDPDYIPRLFEPFTQEDNDNTSRYGGSGLGMAISKSFVEMMDGEITVTSEKGTGSTFTVAVSLGRVRRDDVPEQEASGNAPPDEAALQGCHVLIAEDQAINAEVLTDLLELEGISSEWAENGRLAVDLFAGSEEGHFAAILMDMRMPVLDGLEATREIRKLSRPDAAAIPIIALSANAFEDDVKQCLEAGMNVHLSKPVDMERLKAVLAELIAPSEG